MILLTVVIFTVVQDPEVLPSCSSNQGNEVFFDGRPFFTQQNVCLLLNQYAKNENIS